MKDKVLNIPNILSILRILMVGGKLVEAIILAGGKLGLKKKNEDTVGRILKGLANIILLL